MSRGARVVSAVISALRALCERPALVALLLALVAGTAISILTPPFAGGDEPDHFTRAYQLSTGSFLTHHHGELYGAYLPRTFVTEEERLIWLAYVDKDRTAFVSDLGQRPPSSPEVFVESGNAASYGPGAYVQYMVALAVGRLFGLSLLALLYLARLAGAVTYALILALAVRRLPLGKWIMVAVGVIPAAINQASTVSADGLTMALTFLVVAEALRLSLDEAAPRRRLLVEAALAVGLLGLAKPPYVLMAALFAVPAWKHRRRLAWPLAAIVGEGAALAVAWGAYQLGHSPSQDNPKLWLDVPPDSYAFRDIRTGPQTTFVLSHPWSFLAAVGRTFGTYGPTYARQLFGMLATYQLPLILVVSAALVLVAGWVAIGGGEMPVLTRLDRIALIVVPLLLLLGVFAIAYTSWNAYRAPRIDAVNTRYMLPLLPPLLTGLLPSKLRLSSLAARSGWRYAAVAVGAVTLVATLVGLRHFYYSHPLLPT